MKCKTCQGPLSVNNKGQISCSVCDTIKRKITVQKVVFNCFEYYKVLDSLNSIVDNCLLPEELDALVKGGVEVKIK